MRLRLEDETRLTIRINGEYNTKIDDYTYELAEDLPAGLGPEAFVGAIVEMRMPMYSFRDPNVYFGYKLLYGHVTSVAKETDAYENDATAQITCAFAMDIDYGYWGSDESIGYLEYHPEGCYTGKHAFIDYDNRQRFIDLTIELTKTVDETSGDVTYDGTLTTHYNLLYQSCKQPFVFGLEYRDASNKTERWDTRAIASKTSKRSATIRLARYLDYDPTEVIINESTVTEKTVDPEAKYSNWGTVYVYHLNFTVPAAKVKPGY